jgi:chromate transporter
MPDEPNKPSSLKALFIAFTLLALQGFGGVLAVAQLELCDRRRWLTPADFVQMLATAQVLPGPNICNLSLMVGDRFFGWRGALVALAGMVTAPLILMLALAWMLSTASTSHPFAGQVVRGALGGVAAVAAGQIIGTVLKLAAPLRSHLLGVSVALVLALAAFLMMIVLHWPLLWILFGLGSLAYVLSWRALRGEA